MTIDKIITITAEMIAKTQNQNTLSNRHISQINIKNFTCFADAEAKGLKKINLIVGPNGCGKTYFLNAIDILAQKQKSPDKEKEIASIIYRDILRITYKDTYESDYPYPPEYSGYYDSDLNLTTYFGNNNDAIISSDDCQVVIDDKMRELVRSVNSGKYYRLFHNILYIYNRQQHNEMLAGCIDEIVKKVASEDEFAKHLKLLVPKLDHIRADNRGGLLVAIEGQDMRLPLSSQGYGAVRFALFSALLQGQKNGVFGIDELENGLHYDKYEPVSENLMRACLDYNTQLFVTTHSCELATTFLEAAKKLASNKEIKEDDFALVYLHRPHNKEGVQAYVVNDFERSKRCIEEYRYV